MRRPICSLPCHIVLTVEQKIIRSTIKTYEAGKKPPGSPSHLYHCLNTLRQDLMCKADDTVMESANVPHMIGDNQAMQCRDWDKLVAWARAPERHSCYHIFDDDRSVAHTLEEYAFCPEDSPWYSTMKAYFDEHGHQPLYDDGDKETGYDDGEAVAHDNYNGKMKHDHGKMVHEHDHGNMVHEHGHAKNVHEHNHGKASYEDGY